MESTWSHAWHISNLYLLALIVIIIFIFLCAGYLVGAKKSINTYSLALFKSQGFDFVVIRVSTERI